MRSISSLLPEPYDGDDTSPSVSNSSLYIRKWAIDWLSSGSVPPMSVLISMRGFSAGFTRAETIHATPSESTATAMDKIRFFIVFDCLDLLLDIVQAPANILIIYLNTARHEINRPIRRKKRARRASLPATPLGM